MSVLAKNDTPRTGDPRRVQDDRSNLDSNDPDFERQRAEMQRAIGACLGFISRGLPDSAARYAARAAELGKAVGRRWHREPKVPSERQGVLPFDAGWTWAGEVRDGQADRALQQAGHEA